MSLTFLLPLALGAVTVLQAGLNRRIGEHWGLLPTALFNASVFCLFATLSLLAARNQLLPAPSWLLKTPSLQSIRLYWIVPGLCGFAIVLLMPLSLQRLGALPSFVLGVTAQLVMGAVWDVLVEGIDLTAQRIVGALLAIAGAALVAWR